MGSIVRRGVFTKNFSICCWGMVWQTFGESNPSPHTLWSGMTTGLSFTNFLWQKIMRSFHSRRQADRPKIGSWTFLESRVAKTLNFCPFSNLCSLTMRSRRHSSIDFDAYARLRSWSQVKLFGHRRTVIMALFNISYINIIIFGKSISLPLESYSLLLWVADEFLSFKQNLWTMFIVCSCPITSGCDADPRCSYIWPCFG